MAGLWQCCAMMRQSRNTGISPEYRIKCTTPDTTQKMCVTPCVDFIRNMTYRMRLSWIQRHLKTKALLWSLRTWHKPTMVDSTQWTPLSRRLYLLEFSCLVLHYVYLMILSPVCTQNLFDDHYDALKQMAKSTTKGNSFFLVVFQILNKFVTCTNYG